MKVQITENDIKNMVYDSLHKILNEGRPIYRRDPDGEPEYDGDESDDIDDEEDESGPEYDAWLGHSDLPSSDGRFFHVVFYLDDNGEVNYRCDGYEYMNRIWKYTPEPGSILDQEIRKYMESNMEEIEDNLSI